MNNNDEQSSSGRHKLISRTCDSKPIRPLKSLRTLLWSLVTRPRFISTFFLMHDAQWTYEYIRNNYKNIKEEE